MSSLFTLDSIATNKTRNFISFLCPTFTAFVISLKVAKILFINCLIMLLIDGFLLMKNYFVYKIYKIKSDQYNIIIL